MCDHFEYTKEIKNLQPDIQDRKRKEEKLQQDIIIKAQAESAAYVHKWLLLFQRQK